MVFPVPKTQSGMLAAWNPFKRSMAREREGQEPSLLKMGKAVSKFNPALQTLAS